jgi:hypothetical protein
VKTVEILQMESEINSLRKIQNDARNKMKGFQEQEYNLVSETFEKMFDLGSEVVVNYHNGRILFYMKNEIGQLLEVFSIYFNSNHTSTNMEFFKPYISYYTTSSISTFELNRLKYLGKLASRFEKNQKTMLDIVNQSVANINYYNNTYHFNETDRVTSEQIANLKKELVFTKNKYILRKLLDDDGIMFGNDINLHITPHHFINTNNVKIMNESYQPFKKSVTLKYKNSQTDDTSWFLVDLSEYEFLLKQIAKHTFG